MNKTFFLSEAPRFEPGSPAYKADNLPMSRHATPCSPHFFTLMHLKDTIIKQFLCCYSVKCLLICGKQ